MTDTTRFLLEKLALGELDARERAALDAQMSPEEQERKRRALVADNEAYFRAHPPEKAVAEIQRKLARTSGGTGAGNEFVFGRKFLPAVALAMAAGLAGVYVMRKPVPAVSELDDVTRVKGLEPAIKLYKKTGDSFAPVSPGDAAKEGDRLQVRYRAVGATHGAVVSIDGRGGVTLHFPLAEDGDTRLSQNGEVALNHSYELDDAPRFERFFFVGSPGPLDVRTVLDAAKQLAAKPDARETAALPLPESLTQSAITVRKPQ